jgi:DNA polymerase-3 subunit gamma/tau
MAYEVLARKWRPKQFEDVVGQGHVTRTLQNAIQTKRIAHAYLFVGPRGIGKTSLARIFAKALNCEKGPTATPCDICDSCREIAAGTSLDVMEIDGASNNGVEQVRELRENVKFAPTRGLYKIYLIDEVHMLSSGAFNALLKTLEEPPAHVKFFFATTEAHKILPTIVSRCQRFDLRRIPAGLIVGQLQKIATAEKVSLEGDAALAIARGAEGGMRDAESALDQLIAFRGTDIKEADVLSVFGLVSRQTMESLAEAVLQGNVSEIVRIIGELDAAGKDMQRLVLELLDYFRALLVHLCAPDVAGQEDLVAAQIATLKRQAGLTTADRLLRIADILSQTEDRLRFALSRRTQVETALIRCARTTAVSIDDLLRRLEALGGGGVAVGAPAVARPVAPVVAPVRRVVTTGEAPSAYRVCAPVPAVPAAAPVAAPAAAPVAVPAAAPVAAPAAAPVAAKAVAPGNDLELLTTQWRGVIERVKGVNLLTGVMLMDTRPLAVMADRVVIGFDPEFSKNKESVAKNPAHVRALHDVLLQVLKRPVSLDFQLIQGGGTADVPADHTAESAGGSFAGRGNGAKSKQEWQKDPVVRKALEIFNGGIVDIRE